MRMRNIIVVASVALGAGIVMVVRCRGAEEQSEHFHAREMLSQQCPKVPRAHHRPGAPSARRGSGRMAVHFPAEVQRRGARSLPNRSATRATKLTERNSLSARKSPTIRARS